MLIKFCFCFVNHTTFLIQFPGLNILTDPVWSDKVGPIGRWAKHVFAQERIPNKRLVTRP